MIVRPGTPTTASPFRRMLLCGSRGARAFAFVIFLGFIAFNGISCSSEMAAESCDEGDIGSPPNCYPEPPAPAAPGKSWHVVFSEDFDGTDYDHSKLTPCFDWNVGHCTSTFNKGRETYKPEQVRVSDGTAQLVAEPLTPPERDDACYEDMCSYKSGLLSTARPNVDGGKYLFPFTYGYVEARVMFPAKPGFFTAFWMLPTDEQYKYRSEIDIAEVVGGDPMSLFMTYHHDDRKQAYRVNSGARDNGACPVRDYSQDWVKFGVDWQPDHIAWYVNGVKCGEFTDSTQIEGGPMQLIMNLMVDNDWERAMGSVTTDPGAVARLKVDYIRIYQQR